LGEIARNKDEKREIEGILGQKRDIEENWVKEREKRRIDGN